METRTLTGPGMPDEESAKAAMQGIIDGLGKDGDFEIVSLEAREIDGRWVATLIVRMLDPEPETDEDETGRGESGRESQDKIVDTGPDEFALVHGHLGKNEIGEQGTGLPDPESGAEAIPDASPDIQGQLAHPEADDVYVPPLREERGEVSFARELEDEAKDEIKKAAEESVQSLSEEFQSAETPDVPVNSVYDGVVDYALLTGREPARGDVMRIDTLSELELQKIADEEERQRLAALELAARAAEGPAPDPAQSA